MTAFFERKAAWLCDFLRLCIMLYIQNSGELKTYFRDYGFLLIESEYNESETAKKRIEFYKHCGCKDSMLRGRLYFVEYAFLYLELSTGYSQEKIKEEIYKIYETVYPDYLGTELLVFH